MKKEKLLTLVFITIIVFFVFISLLSVSYAKYITNSSSSDTSRVAIWGVEIDIDSDDLFKTEYQKSDSTVVVSSSSKVIAPGTSGSSTFKISGTPEVSSMLIIDFSADHDLFLKSGTYLNLSTEDNETDVFLLVNDYYPIVYTLEVKIGDQVPVELVSGSLKDIEQAVTDYQQTYLDSLVFMPNNSVDTVFTLTWRYASNLNNSADTWLGMSNANGVQDMGLVKYTDYSFDIEFDFSITVIQID